MRADRRALDLGLDIDLCAGSRRSISLRRRAATPTVRRAPPAGAAGASAACSAASSRRVIQRPRFVWPAIAAPILGATAFLHCGAIRARRPSGRRRTRGRARARVCRDIVIVGIDARSLQALNEWPWPRRHHARLLQQLKRAQRRSSVPGHRLQLELADAEDDSLFERALAEWQGASVVLAAHFQAAAAPTRQRRIVRALCNASLSTLGSPRSCSCRAPTAWSGKCGALGNSKAKRCPPSSRSTARSPRIPPSRSISRLASPPSVTCRSSTS